MDVFSVVFNTVDGKNHVVGPPISPFATPEEFKDKIQQMINAWLVFGYLSTKEELPRFSEYEEAVKQSPIASAIYACCFLKRTWPEAENKIATCKESSLLYAAKLIKGRFIEGEQVISESPEYLLAYSLTVLKRDKLPSFMHRRMIAHAIKDPNNKHIKRYLRFKKVRES